MTKFWKKVLPVGLTALLLCVGIPGAAFAATEDTPDRFVEGTTINNVSVSGLTVDEAKNQIEEHFKGSYSLKIRDAQGNDEVVRDVEIGLSLHVTGDLNEVLKRQNDTGRKSGPGENNSYRVSVDAACDEELLRSRLVNLHCVTGATPTTDAHISAYQEDKPFEIIPEVQGTEIDMEKLVAAVKDAISEQRSVVRLTDSDCYKKVQITSLDDGLNKLCETMNNYKDVTITYTFGEKTEVLTGAEIAQWVTGSSGSEVLVDEEKAAAYVKTLADTYDTYGKPHAFRTTSGRDVSVSGAYGWQINQAEETAALIAAIKTCESQTREPVYVHTAASREGNDFGNTYVEVDLATQHLYLYENGARVLDTPFVSGNVAKGNGTPAGLFTLYYKQTDRVLRGAKQADGTYEYETPVKYWMPFNGGIGLHDANWRSSFGGTIYKTGGSHGCINLPPKVAGTIYEHVYAGMPIICCD